MSNEEQKLYQLLRDDKECRKSNWECVRRYYEICYGISLPKLNGIPKPFTIERKARLMKSEFAECRDAESDKIKQEEVAKFKEMALDHNKFERPNEDIPVRKENWW